jgi:hypothetical protein
MMMTGKWKAVRDTACDLVLPIGRALYYLALLATGFLVLANVHMCTCVITCRLLYIIVVGLRDLRSGEACTLVNSITGCPFDDIPAPSQKCCLTS